MRACSTLEDSVGVSVLSGVHGERLLVGVVELLGCDSCVALRFFLLDGVAVNRFTRSGLGVRRMVESTVIVVCLCVLWS